MSEVNFTVMDHGTREDYDLVFTHDVVNGSHQAERVIGWLRVMDRVISTTRARIRLPFLTTLPPQSGTDLSPSPSHSSYSK